MALVERSDRLPQCSRCRGDLIISAVAPKNDAQGRPIHMELCASCDAGDADRPAAGLLLQLKISSARSRRGRHMPHRAEGRYGHGTASEAAALVQAFVDTALTAQDGRPSPGDATGAG